MADKEPVKVEVVPSSGMVETPSELDKKMLKAQADHLYGTVASYVNNEPTLLTEDGAPPAQGPNLSKEQAEYAAAVAANPKAEDLPEELIPAPVQSSSDPIAPAGKPPKN
jgi:hypothetical protein